ncbi:MAG: hypothetical protein JMN24_18640 [gamma proteobacterium endosymbiont of Lamellibrachia anaximandri]|nr:hypothetical protein [gamma proteobacterium endosymbiont of Lamellibrachia anaximandri]
MWQNSTTTQRKGYYLAGVGLSSGHQLDAIAEEANELLVRVNAAIQGGEQDEAIKSYIRLAEILFEIAPFVPKNTPENWRELLTGWLQGLTINEIAPNSSSQVLDFIEDAFVYRLPWGMEAIKVRAQANDDQVGDFSVDDFELSVAVPALETGTLNISAAVLMQSGFSSRIAAITAVESTDATFVDGASLKVWLASEQVNSLFAAGGWPTVETEPLWLDFVNKITRPTNKVWKKQGFVGTPIWNDAADISHETFLRLHIGEDGKNVLLSRDYSPLGELSERFPANLSGLLISKINHQSSKIDFTYYGEEIV